MSSKAQAEVDELIRAYRLEPHPEGGYFSESYRAKELVDKSALPVRFAGPRVHSTAIYFLLPEGKKSSLHRIAADEVWHFYLGGPLVIVEISPEGVVRETKLGRDFKNGEHLQHVVPAGFWFGAHPLTGSGYSFVGCTVAPGFDFADFELAEREALLRLYPQAEAQIRRLTD